MAQDKLPDLARKLKALGKVNGDELVGIKWRYTGEGLEESDDVLSERIDYTLSTVDDVERLNKEMLEVGSWMSDRFADLPKNRENLRVFVTNLERLQVAIGQLHDLTLDAEDTVSWDSVLQGDLQNLADSVGRMNSRLPDSAKLFLSVDHAVGTSSSLLARSNVLPFEYPDRLACTVTLQGHSSHIHALVVLERRGTMCLASGSEDKTIKLWDADMEKLLGTLQGHSDSVHALTVFECRGMTLLASGSADKTINLWDAEKEELLGTLEGHSEAVLALAVFERDANVCLASGSNDKTIKLWDLEKSELLGTLEGHSDTVRSLVAFKRHGVRDRRVTCLVSGSYDKTIKLWDVEKQELLGILPEDHSHIATSLAVFERRGVMCLASGGWDATIRLWDLENEWPLGMLKGHSSYITALAVFECRGVTCLVSGGWDEAIRLWNVEEEHQFKRVVGNADALVLCKRRGVTCLASAGRDNVIQLWQEQQASFTTDDAVDRTEPHGRPGSPRDNSTARLAVSFTGCGAAAGSGPTKRQRRHDE